MEVKQLVKSIDKETKNFAKTKKEKKKNWKKFESDIQD